MAPSRDASPEERNWQKQIQSDRCGWNAVQEPVEPAFVPAEHHSMQIVRTVPRLVTRMPCRGWPKHFSEVAEHIGDVVVRPRAEVEGHVRPASPLGLEQ